MIRIAKGVGVQNLADGVRGAVAAHRVESVQQGTGIPADNCRRSISDAGDVANAALRRGGGKQRPARRRRGPTTRLRGIHPTNPTCSTSLD